MVEAAQEKPKLHFVIEGNISITDAQAVVREIGQQHGGVTTVSLRTTGGIPVSAEPAVELLGMAGAIASVVSAFVVILSTVRDHQKSKAWTVKRLRELVAQEMVRLGIVGFNVSRVDNFDDLLHRRSGPCVLEIVDVKKCEKYKLCVFQDGKSYVVRLEDFE